MTNGNTHPAKVLPATEGEVGSIHWLPEWRPSNGDISKAQVAGNLAGRYCRCGAAQWGKKQHGQFEQYIATIIQLRLVAKELVWEAFTSCGNSARASAEWHHPFSEGCAGNRGWGRKRWPVAVMEAKYIGRVWCGDW